MNRALALAGALLLASCGASAPTLTEVLATPQGPVQGIVTDDPDIVSYQGIPFAAPPVGDLRWAPPAPAPRWSETRNASEFGSRCMQPRANPDDDFFDRLIDGHGLSAAKTFAIKRIAGALGSDPMSEDCLYLNVRAPKAAKDAPVMVWIHGGGHQFGEANFPYYQGNGLAERGVVLVTLNYRLGVFGYMAHPALSEDDPRGVSGNYGSLDQVAALEWVRDNIEAYGGDPNNVTIFGESAGAWSVTEMMSTPLASGLFHQAIAQSGASSYHMSQLDGPDMPIPGGWPSGHSMGLRVADALGLDDPTAAELRAVPAEEIREKLPPKAEEAFHHIRDGVVFPQNVGLAFATGQINAVPLLTGYNSDEGTLFFDDDGQPSVWLETLEPGTRAELETKLRAPFPQHADALLDVYPLHEDFRTHGIQWMGDEIFGTNIRFAARAVEEAGQPSWTYFFSRVPPSDTQTLGAFHAAEIPFVFDTHEDLLGVSDEDEQLTDIMIGYWANFAKDGNPNGAGLPDWPEHAGENWMHFSANSGRPLAEVEQGVRREKLDLLSEGLQLKLEQLADAKP